MQSDRISSSLSISHILFGCPHCSAQVFKLKTQLSQAEKLQCFMSRLLDT